MPKRKLGQYEEGEKQQDNISRKSATTSYSKTRDSVTPGSSSEDMDQPNGAADHSKQKSKLISALDKVFSKGAKDIDNETLSQCLKLRKSLDNPKNNVTLLEHRSKNSTPQVSTPLCVPSTLTPLTPWTGSSIPQSGSLPPLPKILSSALHTATFTHHGTTHGVTTPGAPVSYERLEWIGDAYIYLLSTHLIYHTFTSHVPGKMAQLRERLVKNETLAGYAHAYDFDKLAILPVEILNGRGPASEKGRVKVFGDIFEAYVGSVILSDPETGIEKVSEWLKELWAGMLAKDIIAQERLNATMASLPLQAPTAVPTTPMLAPPDLDHASASSLALSSIKAPRPPSSIHLNPKDRLASLIGCKGVKIYYKDAGPLKKDRDSKLPLFTVGVYVDIDSGAVPAEEGQLGNASATKHASVTGWQLGWGSAGSKKDAGFKAAEMALANKKIMRELEERKLRVDRLVKIARDKETENQSEQADR